MYKPLEDATGEKKSDHLTIKASCYVQNVDRFRKRTTNFMRCTEEGSKKFSAGLIGIDWQRVFKDVEETPTSLVAAMQQQLETLTGDCFKMVKRTYKSTDAQWITPQIKRQIKKRKRVYEKDKKRSDAWKIEKRKTEELISKSKKEYFDRQADKL